MADKNDITLVVGLGRFGGALAASLEELGHQVLAVDDRMELVQEWSGKLTHVVQADATSADAMRQIGAHEVDVAVVAIGTGVEGSVLCTAVLADLGVREIWAKAITAAHGRILERIGASHVVYPERDAGERVARILDEGLVDFTGFDDGFAMAKSRVPKRMNGLTVADTKLRSSEGLTIVAVRPAGGRFENARDDTVLNQGDLLIVAGDTDKVERFGRIQK